ANCSIMIDEIIHHLKRPPNPLLDPNNLNSEDMDILMERNLRTPNLLAFVRAVKHLENASAIESILKNLLPCLPLATAAPTRHPIHIKDGDWNEFRRKLTFYLKTLENAQAQQ
uniref:INTERLEUKIN 3 n=1 Tax=Homo sapiens TaxID=9606 RepID=UPI0000111F97|nr:Chain A, INTERLEUKIN 3 [Homo sapiens]